MSTNASRKLSLTVIKPQIILFEAATYCFDRSVPVSVVEMGLVQRGQGGEEGVEVMLYSLLVSRTRIKARINFHISVFISVFENGDEGKEQKVICLFFETSHVVKLKVYGVSKAKTIPAD